MIERYSIAVEEFSITIEDAEEEMRQAITDRENADDVSLQRAQQVVNGVLAEPLEGPDSTLYESFGYTARRDRASGPTRKSSKKKPIE